MTTRWAVVTGASAGIGEAFARELAARGWNLVLAARRLARLQRLADTLPVSCRRVRADLGQPDDRDLLWREVLRLDTPPELLVNNAGFGLLGAHADLGRVRQLEMIQVNVAALTDLAHRYLRLRREAGGGALINVASVVGLRPLPNHAVYAATKAYVVSYSLALAEELRAAGVRVQALCPGPVPTEFQQVAGVTLDRASRLVAISAEQVVQESLAALERDRPLVVPGRALRTISGLLRLVPAGLARELMRRRGEG